MLKKQQKNKLHKLEPEDTSQTETDPQRIRQ